MPEPAGPHRVKWLGVLRDRLLRPFRTFTGGSHRWDVREPSTEPRGEPPIQPLEPASTPAREGLGAQSSADEEARRVALSMQAALLPTGFPTHPAFELFAATMPARFVGGDFFDYFFTPSGKLTIVIADASGKGVPAGMFMAVTRTVIRDLGMQSLGPGETLRRANELLVASNPQCMFVTLFLGEYEPQSGLLRYANGGHPGPVLLSASGSLRIVAGVTGTVMGAIEGLAFEQRELTIAPGDRLVFYTDGVIEAKLQRGTGAESFLGEAGLLDLCAGLGTRSVDELCRELLGKVVSLQHGDLHDDATVLVLGRAGRRKAS